MKTIKLSALLTCFFCLNIFAQSGETVSKKIDIYLISENKQVVMKDHTTVSLKLGYKIEDVYTNGELVEKKIYRPNGSLFEHHTFINGTNHIKFYGSNGVLIFEWDSLN